MDRRDEEANGEASIKILIARRRNKAAVDLFDKGMEYYQKGLDQNYRKAVDEFYSAYYFRPGKIWEITSEMLTDWQMMKRRLREGVEFMKFLNKRENRDQKKNAAA